jgi:serine/threonine protein kinase
MDAARIRRLFISALDLEPERRQEMLEKECSSEEERKSVLDLLEFDCGDAASLTIHAPITEVRREAIAGRFGPFELKESIGHGGMGAVYRAERVDGEVCQTVAIKILDRGWLDPKAVGRFRRERQILSGLAHPNIARLLDTGTRDDGRPYLVMELIDGAPIDQYCRRHNLSVRDRLRLFLPVCQAVAYAHSKLVIHRDLKPSNILVTAQGEPKLLDFGIARVLDEDAASSTNTFSFTPLYACPDLARGEPPSTAMDVYGLGAVLYFLLTGVAPHRVEGLTPLELVRHLSETQPPPAATIRPELKGDIENILGKAMHIEPERRYRSAHEVAADIENYLAMRPVRATPDSVPYRAGRFLVRRRWSMAAASMALAAALAGAFFVWIERRRADEEAATARAVSEFLQKDLIGQAGLRSQIERGTTADPDLKVRTILDRASVSVPVKFAGMPKVEAAVQTAIAGAYKDLGLDEEALKHYQRSFELLAAATSRSSPETLEAANLLGNALSDLGKTKEAEAVYRETIAAAGRPREGRRAAAFARYGLAMGAAAQKRHEALQALDQAIAELRSVVDPGDESVLSALNQLAVLHLEAGNADPAEKLLREVFETRSRILGERHPDTLASMSELGVFYFRRSRFQEGEEFLKRAAEGMESVLGPEHPVTLSTLNNLTQVYIRQGNSAQSAAIRLRILEGMRKLRGPEHPDTLAAEHNIASSYVSAGNYSAAIKQLENSLERMRRVLGTEHPVLLSSMRLLASAYRETGRLPDSTRIASETLSISQRVMGSHVDTAAAMNELARSKKAGGALAEAERLFRDALAMRLKLLGANHQSTMVTKNDLAGLLQAAGRYPEAESLFVETLAAKRKLLGETHASTLNTMSDLASLYRLRNKLDESAALQERVLESRRKTLGPEHPNTLRAMRELAAVYRDQKRFREAQALIASVLKTIAEMESKGETILGLSIAGLKREQSDILRFSAPPKVRAARTGSPAK